MQLEVRAFSHSAPLSAAGIADPSVAQIEKYLVRLFALAGATLS
jgi:hypothetical protein